MGFKEAIERTRHLETAYQTGLQALRAQDRAHLEIENTRKVAGSADIDNALRAHDPHGNRWDFAVAYQHTNQTEEIVYWLELHTANDSQVKVVIRKARWLLNWLRNDGHRLKKFEREIIWISSGPTSFTLSAPQKKEMAEVGLRHKGSMLRIRNDRQ